MYRNFLTIDSPVCDHNKQTFFRISWGVCSKAPNRTNISVQNISKTSADMVHFSMEFILRNKGPL